MACQNQTKRENVCVCVCMRGRERKRQQRINSLSEKFLILKVIRQEYSVSNPRQVYYSIMTRIEPLITVFLYPANTRKGLSRVRLSFAPSRILTIIKGFSRIFQNCPWTSFNNGCLTSFSHTPNLQALDQVFNSKLYFNISKKGREVLQQMTEIHMHVKEVQSVTSSVVHIKGFSTRWKTREASLGLKPPGIAGPFHVKHGCLGVCCC